MRQNARTAEKSPDKPIPAVALRQIRLLSLWPGRGLAAHIACRLLVLLVGLLIVLASTWAHAASVDPAQLAHLTVSIMRHFDEPECDARPDLIGIRGTGWSLSPTMIVTAAHVAEAMKLSIQDWKAVEIADEHGRVCSSSPAR